MRHSVQSKQQSQRHHGLARCVSPKTLLLPKSSLHHKLLQPSKSIMAEIQQNHAPYHSGLWHSIYPLIQQMLYLFTTPPIFNCIDSSFLQLRQAAYSHHTHEQQITIGHHFDCVGYKSYGLSSFLLNPEQSCIDSFEPQPPQSLPSFWQRQMTGTAHQANCKFVF